MPYVQRDSAGLVVGEFANLQLGYAEEWLPVDALELVIADSRLVDVERAWRDAELASLIWLRDRHRDQLDMGSVTTLTAEQFSDLLLYMQALRDWPQSPSFPDVSLRPAAPPWIAEQVE
jgi:hypothetical protein